LRELGLEPPFYISMALLGVRGHCLVTGSRFFFQPARALRRDALLFPEVFCEDANPNAQTLLKPLFDLLWQAFGQAKSFSFDAEGRYIGTR
jgi:hypothetical protein